MVKRHRARTIKTWPQVGGRWTIHDVHTLDAIERDLSFRHDPSSADF
jgi:hypothetical protein